MSAIKERLAIRGGEPVRPALLPYGRQYLDDDDIAAVVAILRSDWLTTGPTVDEFEKRFARSRRGRSRGRGEQRHGGAARGGVCAER